MWDLRRNQILEIVDSKGYVTSLELSQMLNKSLSTIQRDLIDLNEKGLLVRIWSGAKSVKHQEKMIYNTVEQQPITGVEINRDDLKIDISLAAHAASMVQDNDLIYMDDSAETYLMMGYLDGKRIKIISNSWKVISKAYSLHLSGTLLGGDLDVAKQSFSGMITLDNLSRFKFAKAFIGAASILPDGIFVYSMDEAEIKQKVVSRSIDVFVLANNVKFDKIGYYKVCDLTTSKVITNQPIPQSIIETNENFIFAE